MSPPAPCNPPGVKIKLADADADQVFTPTSEPGPPARAVAAASGPALQLRALGHPARLALNRALQARSTGAVAAGELAAIVGVPVRDVRRHLRVLAAAGLVAVDGSGRLARYSPVLSASREAAYSVHTPLLAAGADSQVVSGFAGPPSARLRLLSCVAEQVADGVALIDADGWLVYANPAFAAMHGYGDEDLAGKHFTTFYPRQGQEVVLAELIAEAREHGVGRAETWRLRVDGSLFPAAVTLSLLRDEQGELVGRVLSVQDITSRRAWEDQLLKQALHDPLTGLPNRRLLLERLSQLLSSRGSCSVAVLFCDLDGFKQVNDRHGHDTGDALLVEVTRRLATCLRPEDTLARLGGDEFVALLPGADQAAAQGVADRFRAAIRGPVRAGARVLTVDLSIGIAVDSAGSADRLLAGADAAMYRDKATRRA